MQRISISNLLNDFMQAHCKELAAALILELINCFSQDPVVQHRTIQYSVDYLQEVMHV
ncbi:phage polarity suppression protein [Enterobacter sp. kpr-6]|uniref:phage polarity suppression protein n=1 Tax=Enterobacter sp. kpr-6 TaxID=1761782 RepID=UPI001160351A